MFGADEMVTPCPVDLREMYYQHGGERFGCLPPEEHVSPGMAPAAPPSPMRVSVSLANAVEEPRNNASAARAAACVSQTQHAPNSPMWGSGAAGCMGNAAGHMGAPYPSQEQFRHGFLEQQRGHQAMGAMTHGAGIPHPSWTSPMLPGGHAFDQGMVRPQMPPMSAPPRAAMPQQQVAFDHQALARQQAFAPLPRNVGPQSFAPFMTQAPVHSGIAPMMGGGIGHPSMAQGSAVAGTSTSTAPARSQRGGTRRLRLWAHIYLHMQVPNFDLVPRLIGRGGCNMRKIAETTGAKIRIRGRGSGHLEIDGVREAPVPLMVAVTTDKADPAAFHMAMEMTLKVLRDCEGRFHEFIAANNIQHEGACYSIGNMPDNARPVVADLLGDVPTTPTAA